MGFYDGLNCTTAASAWALADTLGLPVLLVVQPKGASVTLAAQINGLKISGRRVIWRASSSTTAPPVCTNCLPPCWSGRPGCPCWAICPICPTPLWRAAIWG